jgi:CheY-like chemotaxis protein
MDTEIMTLKKILLVEDDPDDVKLTLAGLAENDLANKVAVVRDGAEALDYLYCRGKFKTRPPGNPILVLLDNKMPKVSGLQVLKAIKIDEHLMTIPVVVLTSSRQTPDLLEFYKHGVNAYVVKPMDFSAYMKAIRQLGAFWASVNEPPPVAWQEETSIENSEVIAPEKIEVENGIPAPHFALGG